MACSALDEAAIANHATQYLGDSSGVLHALAGGCHIYHYPARSDRGCQTIMTMGLSGSRMPVPSDVKSGEDHAHAELIAYLPADWPREKAARWPFSLLRSLAEYAVENKVWLGPLHTLPNLRAHGQPYAAGSLLTSALLVPPVSEDPKFDELRIGKTRVRFLAVIPLTTAELELKVAAGFKAIVGHLESGAIPTIFDPKRPSAV
jgi:hypothetical protein